MEVISYFRFEIKINIGLIENPNVGGNDAVVLLLFSWYTSPFFSLPLNNDIRYLEK